MIIKYAVVVSSFVEDTVYVIANSEEEAENKAREALTINGNTFSFDTDMVEYVGGWTEEPVIEISGYKAMEK